jgi:hypothetical protein
LLTDSDSYYTGSQAEDQCNRRHEKSIGQLDQTHSLKLNTLYELRAGKGKRLLSSGGLASRLLGGWRLGGVQSYSSGFPLAVSSNKALPGGFADCRYVR